MANFTNTGNPNTFTMPISPFYSGDNTTLFKNKFTSQFVKKRNDPSQAPDSYSMPMVNRILAQI